MYKYRIYPTEAQIGLLEKQLQEACELYNAAIEERIGAWKICRKSLNFYDQCRQIKPMRDDGCLSLIPFSTAVNVLKRVDRNFTAFFSQRAAGNRRRGRPRFKPASRYNSITFPQPDAGWRLFTEKNRLRIQGIGHIKIRLHRPVDGKIKRTTIKRHAGHWYAFFTVECTPKPMEPVSEGVGIDVGLSSFAVLSTGERVDNPRIKEVQMANLAKQHRAVSRCSKTSKRRQKALLLLQKKHAAVARQRADFQHKLARRIVNRFGLIAVEKLKSEWVDAGNISTCARDAAWFQFFNFLAYKAESAGREFVKVEARNTSQTCLCGAKVKKTLQQRVHSCPSCGLSMDRDHVSALVILKRAGNRPTGANAG